MTSTGLKFLRMSAALVAVATGNAVAGEPSLENTFAHPPATARPWVYWFWSDGNVTRDGITADLAAMQRVGIGGVLIMDVDQNVPHGPARFMTPAWRELFAFAVGEAERFGLEISLNNDAGWTGSGGPWIDAEHSMQKVVWTETRLSGPQRFEGSVTRPEAVEGFYRDIALLAFPAASSVYRIENYGAKSGLGLVASPDDVLATDPGVAIERDRIIDLTGRLRDGRLEWDVPPGEWTLLRFGHASTGKTNYPSPEPGKGLEVDKLSRVALDRHYDGFAGRLLAELGPAASRPLTIVHVDSWEVGYQNWTSGFREAFHQRRGYDLVSWLPTLTGRVVGTEELSERFLWDVRRTISELLNDNYAARLAERAHADGRKFSLQAYRYGPFDCLSYAGRADVPIGEFWVTRDPANLHPSVKTMTSAGHIYGKRVIAAEAFTASDTMGRQQHHPYSLKAIGDAAFCAGINQLILHRYSMQPWVDDRKPGMTMGPWGVEYERTATWWEQTKPWHEYLSRAQHLLQQGRFVADLCYLQSEEGFNNPALPAQIRPAVPTGYDFDFCSDEVLLTRMAVEDGRLVLPDGMSYRVLVLPSQRLMTPVLLRKIRDLVRAGATVYGPPPWRSPSLSGYPECDDEVRRLIAELWVDCDCDAENQIEHAFTLGKVIWGPTLEQVLARRRIQPDFVGRHAGTDETPARSIRYIHRTLPDRELYFVANLGDAAVDIVASFRVDGRQPELWRAEDGTIEHTPVYDCVDGRVRLPFALEPRGSVFVVFKHDMPAAADRIVEVRKNGSTSIETKSVSIEPTTLAAKPIPDVVGTFTIAAWVKPAADTTLTPEASTGTAAYSVPRNDVLFPPPAHEVLGRLDAAGVGFAVGRNGISVLEHGDHHFPATLVHPVAISDWTHVVIVVREGVPSLYLDGQLVRTGAKSRLSVRGGVGVPHGRDTIAFRGEHSALQQFNRALDAEEIRKLMRAMSKTPIVVARQPDIAPAVRSPRATLRFMGSNQAWTTEAAGYEFVFADGRVRRAEVKAPPTPIAIEGPWALQFPGGWGAPARVELSKLISWPEHSETGVRYFSGTATYTKTFELPADFVRGANHWWLDLGDVAVIAEVMLNGRAIGTLWRPPFRIEVGDTLRAGWNELEIKVTNLWPNRLIGDEQLPADREWVKVPRRGGFALKEYPDWFQRGERSPAGRVTFATWKHYEKDAPLLPSGLLGPVTIQPEVRVSWAE